MIRSVEINFFFSFQSVTIPRTHNPPLCNSCMKTAYLCCTHSSRFPPLLKGKNNVYGNIPKYFVISLYISFKGQVGLDWVRFISAMGWVNFLTQRLKDISIFTNDAALISPLPNQP